MRAHTCSLSPLVRVLGVRVRLCVCVGCVLEVLCACGRARAIYHGAHGHVPRDSALQNGVNCSTVSRVRVIQEAGHYALWELGLLWVVRSMLVAYIVILKIYRVTEIIQ